MSQSELYNNLLQEVIAGNVSMKEDGPYRLFCYTQKCVIERNWNETTLLARGIVFDSNTMRVAASCMPKFFNLFENNVGINNLPLEPFVAHEKLDGSLIHIWWDNYNNKWRANSKGSFESDQAKWSQNHIDKYWNDIPYTPTYNKDITFVCEAIYPENKIVVDYNGINALYILTAYDNNSLKEIEPHAYVWNFANQTNFRFPNTYNHNNILEDAIKEVSTFSKNREGFVIRYKNGHRVKIKGQEYLRIHKALSNFTPLAIYEVLCHSESIDSCRQTLRLDLPEEFWPELDNILRIFESNINSRKERFNKITSLDIYKTLKQSGSRKDFAIYINKYIETSEDRSLYFMDLDNKPITMYSWVKPFRPANNVLPGYSNRKSVDE